MTRWQKVEKPFRVQLHAYLDRWMMGDRYGTVVAVRPSILRNTDGTRKETWQVLLDKSNKLIRINYEDCSPL